MSALPHPLHHLLRIMADALEDHEGTVSIGGKTIANFSFADIDGLAGLEQELVKLVNHLEEASTAYGMQISAEKTQLMTNNTNGRSTDITIDNKKLGPSVALNIWELYYRMRDPSLKYSPG